MSIISIPTLEAVVAAHGGDASGLVLALREREDLIVDALRLVSVTSFGLHPQIVAEVFTNMLPMLGTEADEVTRTLIHQQFIAHIEDLRRQQGDN